MNSEFTNSLKQDFGFTHHHILILKTLEKEPLRAEEISTKTDIPMGRIYSYLRFLEERGLIDKTIRPSTYSAKNLQSKLYKFIESEYDRSLKQKSMLLNALEKAEHLEITTSVDEFKDKLYDTLKDSKYLHYVDVGTSVPLIFLPESEFEALKVIRAYHKRYVYSESRRMSRERFWKNLSKFPEIKHLLEKNTCENFFNSILKNLGPKETFKRIQDIRKKIKKYVIEIRIQEGFPANHMVITDRLLLNSFYFADKFFALKIISPKIVESYNEMFNQVFEVATPIEIYFKRFTEENKLGARDDQSWAPRSET